MRATWRSGAMQLFSCDAIQINPSLVWHASGAGAPDVGAPWARPRGPGTRRPRHFESVEASHNAHLWSISSLSYSCMITRQFISKIHSPKGEYDVILLAHRRPKANGNSWRLFAMTFIQPVKLLCSQSESHHAYIRGRSGCPSIHRPSQARRLSLSKLLTLKRY